ncbi:type II toxin-antitoxin system HicB family antitoxin [Candidatus Jorgensenbacteria bacterium]|nr:type II toxin-antitoxin system HicB family antitoxin [Candidatus Jorgensenbacteria bacterium]
MVKKDFVIVIEKSEKYGYVVTCPELPDLLTEGNTLQEARDKAKTEIKHILQLRKANEESLIPINAPLVEILEIELPSYVCLASSISNEKGGK